MSLWGKNRGGAYTRMGLLGLLLSFCSPQWPIWTNTWPSWSATWNILRCNRGENLLCCWWSSHVGSNKNGKRGICLIEDITPFQRAGNVTHQFTKLKRKSPTYTTNCKCLSINFCCVQELLLPIFCFKKINKKLE